MKLYKVVNCYDKDKSVFTVLEYDLIGHLECCWKWYGIRGLKRCYLFRKHAEKKAERLNRMENNL